MLPRLQEHILLKVHQIGPDCTATQIQEAITADLNKEQSFGSMFTTLERLNDSKYVTWKKGDREDRRGGRAPRLYTITGLGRSALAQSIDSRRSVFEGADIQLTPEVQTIQY